MFIRAMYMYTCSLQSIMESLIYVHSRVLADKVATEVEATTVSSSLIRIVVPKN